MSSKPKFRIFSYPVTTQNKIKANEEIPLTQRSTLAAELQNFIERTTVVQILLFLLILSLFGFVAWALWAGYDDPNTYCNDCCKNVKTLLKVRYTDNDLFGSSGECFDDVDCHLTLFSPSSNDAVGGAFVNGLEDGLFIDSQPFTSTYPASGSGPDPSGGLDHVKWLAYLGDGETFSSFSTDVGGCDARELVYEGYVSCRIELGDVPYNVTYPDEDYRLAACGFNTIAFPQFNTAVGSGAWKVADFFFTAKSIVIIDERLPFGKPAYFGGYNDYMAYTSVVQVAKRTEDEFHKVAIAFNRARGTIRYLLDDHEVYRTTRPGFAPGVCDTAIYHGGENEHAFPDNVSFGFGTFTILDAHQLNDGQCKPNAALARLTTGNFTYGDPFNIVDGEPAFPGNFVKDTPDLSDRIWGQGAQMIVEWVRVGTQECGCN